MEFNEPDLPNKIEKKDKKIVFEDLQYRLEESMRNLDNFLESIKEKFDEDDIKGQAALLVDFRGQVTGYHETTGGEWTTGDIGTMWMSPTEGPKVHLNVDLGGVPVGINNNNDELLDVVTPQAFNSHQELRFILETRLTKLFGELQSILDNNVIKNTREIYEDESPDDFYKRKIQDLLRISIDCDVHIKDYPDNEENAKLLKQDYSKE